MRILSREQIGNRKAERIFNRLLRETIHQWVVPARAQAAMDDLDRVLGIGYELGLGNKGKADVWLKCPRCPRSAGGYGFSRDAIASALKMEYRCNVHDVLLEIVDTK